MEFADPDGPVDALRTRHSWIEKETKGGFEESGSEKRRATECEGGEVLFLSFEPF